MTLDVNIPVNGIVVRDIPQYIRNTYVEINTYSAITTSIQTEVENARLGFDDLMSFNSALRERVTLTENEIHIARGTTSSLNARFNASEGRLELIESEISDARGLYTTINLRLNAADADRDALWVAIADIVSDILSINDQIAAIYIHFQLYYTKSEIDLLLSQMATDISDAMAAVVNGTAIEIATIWELDVDGDVRHVDSLPVFFAADPDDNLFQTVIGQAFMPRDSEEDVSAVVDPFFTIDPVDSESIMPVTTAAPTTLAPTTI